MICRVRCRLNEIFARHLHDFRTETEIAGRTSSRMARRARRIKTFPERFDYRRNQERNHTARIGQKKGGTRKMAGEITDVVFAPNSAFVRKDIFSLRQDVWRI